MFVYIFHRSMRRDYAKICKLISEEDVESGYPEEIFVTETTDELIPSPPSPPPGKTAKLSGTECNCHQLSSFLNHFIAEISNVWSYLQACMVGDIKFEQTKRKCRWIKNEIAN